MEGGEGMQEDFEAFYLRHFKAIYRVCYAFMKNAQDAEDCGCSAVGAESLNGEWIQEVLCDNFHGTTWNKVPLPTVPAEEITAWYKHTNRAVSYNDGQYETDSIYERKYLDGSDQYAVFLNSNQAQTVIEGSSRSGRPLLIKLCSS